MCSRPWGWDATLTWASWDDLPSSASREQWLAINREKLQLPPRFLPSSAAGHVAQGLDDSLNGIFSWADIEQLVQEQNAASGQQGTRLLLLSMMADLVGSNNLVKHLWAERAASHNARVRDVGYGTFIVILDGPCQGHIVHRIQTSCFQTKQLVSKVYNCCFTLNNVNKWAVLRAGLVRVVKEDLGVNLFRSQRPSVQNREHNQRILESTYLRHRHIKSRQHVADNSREREATSTAEMLLDILNGDWRKDCLQHWCFEPRCPCQKNIDTLVDLVVPLLERAVFEPMSARTPATSRWHTYGPAVEGGSLGFLLCKILPRAFHAAGPLAQENSEDQNAAASDGSQEWRDLCNAKARDASDCSAGPSRACCFPQHA